MSQLEKYTYNVHSSGLRVALQAKRSMTCTVSVISLEMSHLSLLVRSCGNRAKVAGNKDED